MFKRKISKIRDENNRDSYKHQTFKNACAQGEDFSEESFLGSTLINVDFRNAILGDANTFEDVESIENPIFDETTTFSKGLVEYLQDDFPLVAHELRRVNYIKAFQKKHFIKYLVWKCSCNCGRSWQNLLYIGFFIVLVFTVLYQFGQYPSANFRYPQIHFVNYDSSNTFLLSLQFSMMTFTSFSMAGVEWFDDITGLWIALETWLGIAFLGILISAIATNMNKNS